jgi:high-affinity K+ transport system ATPase subunit B
MTAVFFVLLGVALTLGVIVGWAVYLTATSAGRTEAQLARLEQLRAERQMHRITQDAVAQMLSIARVGRSQR